MTTAVILYLVPLIIIAVLCSIMIFCGHYDDGVIGKLALVGMWLISIGVLADTVDGVRYEPYRAHIAVTWSFCVFLMRHYYRWRMYSTHGLFAWGKRKVHE